MGHHGDDRWTVGVLERLKALGDILNDEAFWREQRAQTMSTMVPLFIRMFQAGAAMGARRKPRTKDEMDDIIAETGLPELVFDADRINLVATEFITQYTNTWWDALEANTRTRLRSAIQTAQANGLGVADVMKQIADLFTSARAMRIATSELTNLLGAGSQATFSQAGFPQWEWRTVQDARVDPECDELNGNVFSMSILFEKAHVNCVPGDTLVAPLGRVLATTERAYDGELFIIRTASGNDLRCTPNHPVLTDTGYVPAQFLDVGRHVVRDLRREFESSLVHEQNHHVPARIEDVAKAFGNGGQMLAVPMPTAAEDFHGDGMGSKIAVVRANRLLWDGHDASLFKHAPKTEFLFRRPPEMELVRSSALQPARERRRDASRRIMSGRDLTLSTLGTHLRPFQPFGSRPSPGWYPGVHQASANDTARYPETLADRVLRLPAFVGADDLALDQITVIERLPQWVGHVYNLQTESGSYTAGGIVTANCRCFPVPVGQVSDIDIVPIGQPSPLGTFSAIPVAA